MGKFQYIFVLFLMASHVVVAAPYQMPPGPQGPKADCNIHRADFDPLRDAADATKLGVPEEIRQSVLKLEDITLSSSTGSCSSVITSKKGYVLSAAHCFETCFRHRHYVDWIEVYKGSGRYAGNIWQLKPGPKKKTCVVKLGGREVDVEIVIAPKCVLGEENSGDFLKREVQEGDYRLLKGRKEAIKDCHTYKDDVVLLKVLGPIEFTSCLPLARQDPPIDEEVWAVGYPQSTGRILSRSGARDVRSMSSVHDRFVSRGTVMKNQDFCEIQADSGNRIEKFKPKQVASFKDMIQVSADAVGGNSGGVLTGATKQVQGIVTASYNSYIGFREEYFCKGGAHAVKPSVIWERTIAAVGEEKAKEMLSCDDEQPQYP